MSRITKQIAKDIAIKLTAKRKQNVNSLRSEYVQFIHESFLKQVPKEVMELFDKYPSYFHKTCSITFSGNGFRFESVSLPSGWVPAGTGGYATLILDDDLSEKIAARKKKYEKAESEYKGLVDQIERALFSLVTFAKVQANFPEAAPFLPVKQTNALAINFSDIRQKIK